MGKGMEKLIYVHVVRLGKSFKKGVTDSGYADATNDWYVIKQRKDGSEMIRVFEDVDQLNHLGPALLDTCCEVIGSCIYVIGGLSVMCRRPYEIGGDEGSGQIRFLDTRNPKDGWRTCFAFPFTLSGCESVVIDNRWLYLFGGNRRDGCFPPKPWAYAVNVDDNKAIKDRVREIAQPGNSVYAPLFSAYLSSGILVAYMSVEGTLYGLDCMNNVWSEYQNDLPYSAAELVNCTTAVFDGILYIYDSDNMTLTSYDIYNKKELYVVGLPHSFGSGLDYAVELIVLSKDRFCIIQDMNGDVSNELILYYTRFSISYDTPEPSVVLEEDKSFHVLGCRLLNVVAVDPHSDVASTSSSISRSN
ncbi:hypothetical protein QN277_026489 [Acacia crassicarpa]|uniref:Uncharacterized protein n=1 Tax=Acacia crassicarpa TaxID=499986 RepID=A0AAE1MHG0_9FABA|nr:hypothetical protein QN277_026489 [Acacia crassicarpa]